MIRRIKFDSGNKNNTFNNYGSNNVSFGGPKIKYGFPQRDWDEFRPQPMSREEEEPPMIKYGYPQAPFELDETTVNDTKSTNISREKSRYKYAIPQTLVAPKESDEDIAREINEDLFCEEETLKEEASQKTSYFKRLWFAILGKDAQ